MSFGFGFGFPGGASTAGGPSLSLQFVGSTALSPLVTFTRGSQAMLFDSTGTLAWAPNNVIRNNMMVGAVAGNPGTPPTNWNIVLGGGATGVNREIVGTGVENGITYVDIRLVGTASGNYAITIANEPITGVPAINGQTWTYSVWVKIAAGSFSGFNTPQIIVEEYSAASAYLAGQNTNVATPTSTLTRISATRTNTNASTAFEYAGLRYYIANGQSVDITLRIGMPQLERGSVATAVNATSGTAYYGPRFDYDPSTLAARGLLIEEQRVNSIRNNTMQGAVAGTPGTVPTNWTGPNTTGLSREIVGTGVENGITYIDIRYFGTASSTGVFSIQQEPNNGVAALNGQAWTYSAYVKLVGGSTTNITSSQIYIDEYSSAPAFLAGQTANVAFPSATMTRVSATRTNNNASTAFEAAGLRYGVNSGSAVDITLRIGLPQLEQGAFATSVIPTTGSTATRNADSASITGANFSSWYNATEGTLFAEVVGLMPSTLGGNRAFAALSDNTYNNMVQIYKTAAGASWGAEVITGGGPAQASYFFAVYTQNSIAKIAIAYAANNVNAAANGSAGTTDTSATIPTVTKLELRDPTGASGGQPTGYLRRITYYPRRLSNTELQAITA